MRHIPGSIAADRSEIRRVQVALDWEQITQEYSNYFGAVSSWDPLSGVVYGIKIYHVLIRCLETLRDKEGEEKGEG